MRQGKRGTNGTNKKKKTIILVALFLVVIIACGVVLAMKMFNKPEVEEVISDTEEVQAVEEPKIDVFSGDDRPIAVMIDNNTNAWPHSGIEKAYMVYEIIVEGGETRLMALFKGQEVEKIGPVRSSRHYFLDYVMENDAIYAHHGWSPQAKKDISSLGINNINAEGFWRGKERNAPHNSYTSTEIIMEQSEKRNYRTTSDKGSVLNYVADEINLESDIVATNITIPYSGNYNIIKYEYDEANKVYIKYSKNKKQVAEGTGKDLTVKNIIITFAANDDLSGAGKGRQDLHNIGTLDGYYITNGKAIKIKCEKTSRSSGTVYKDLEGNEIEVNDGNTYVQICPIDSKVTIE